MAETIFVLIFFLLGFFILIKGAQYLVRGAISLSKAFDISPWFIGIVIVGIGTSVPELAITIASSFDGNAIGLATIIGSNIFTLLFILGLSAILAPIYVYKNRVFVDLPLNMVAISAAAIAILFSIFGEDFMGITRLEGIVLLVLFGVWLFFMLARRHMVMDEAADYRIFTVFTSILLVLAGIAGVFLGGNWVVEGAEFIALSVGVAPGIVGLTIIAIGTSLPELAVSLTAFKKGSPGLAVGNVIGSNIFTFLAVLGAAAVIKPVLVSEAIQFDILAALGAVIVVMAALLIGARYCFARREGIVLVLLYAAYLISLILR